MENEPYNKIKELKEKGVSPLYRIWIINQEQDDETYDVTVWDEYKKDIVYELEVCGLGTLEHAEEEVERIVKGNPNITFVRTEMKNN